MSLQTQVRWGLLWASLNNVVLRLGSLLLGVVLARLLTPEQFGVYAVALTVQTVLMTMADLGLSADLVRSPDPERRAPTVASLGLASGAVLAVGMVLVAGPLASALGSPESTATIQVLAGTLVLAGAGIVPYAMLNRRFQQKQLLVIACVDFVIGSSTTLLLVLAGWGVMALAIGRVLAQVCTLLLQFRLSHTRPRYGIDRLLVLPVLRFGLPLAGANMLSWALLGIDKVVVAKLAGPVALGFYVLAFNVSSWPMSAIGQVVRSVALPAFSRGTATSGPDEDSALAIGAGLAWAVALPAGLLLAALGGPLISGLYGTRWSPAAPALVALGLFGALRVLFDVFVAYLMARGRSGSVLWVQGVWFLALLVALTGAVREFGASGAGWAHVVVALVVVLPAYALCLARTGASIARLFWALWPPTVAALPSALVAAVASAAMEDPWASLVFGGTSGGLVYVLCIGPWVRRQVLLSSLPSQQGPAVGTGAASGTVRSEVGQ